MIATLAPSWHDDHARDLRCHSWDHRDTYLWLHLVLPTIAVHYQDYSHTFYFLESCSPLYRPQPSPGPLGQDECHDCISLNIIYILFIYFHHISSSFLITGCFPQYHGFDLPYHRICLKRHIGLHGPPRDARSQCELFRQRRNKWFLAIESCGGSVWKHNKSMFNSASKI